MTPTRLLSVLLRGVVAGVLVLMGLPWIAAAPAQSADNGDDKDTPLAVRLTSITPSVLPKKAPLTLSGTVTNRSDEVWQDINVHPFTSPAPMTTSDELEAAVATDPETFLGDRLTTPGTFAPIGDLGPGATATFTITLEPEMLQLSRDPGVYWIGVHALGTGTTGRTTAGRDRTFIPLIDAKSPKASAALVLPIRARVLRGRDGKLLEPDRWADLLSPTGRLTHIVNLGASAGVVPVTWLVDPAVLGAARSMADGNPKLDLGGDRSKTDAGTTPTQSPDTPEGPDGSAESDDASEDAAPEAVAAGTWLTTLTESMKEQSVLGLAYADPDTSAVARVAPSLLRKAAALAASTFEDLGITATPAVAPPDGALDPDTLAKIAPESVVLLSDRGRPRKHPVWHTRQGQPLVFSDERSSSGGPLPGSKYDALVVRQQILAAAALRALAGTTEPMVVSLPRYWEPGPTWGSAQFFEGLAVPWLSLVGAVPDPAVSSALLPKADPYPSSRQVDEVTASNVEATRRLVRSSAVFGSLLKSSAVRDFLTGAAFGSSSYNARRRPGEARDSVTAMANRVRERMAKVRIVGSPFVTMSGGSGTLTVTLVNDLDETVTVGTRALTRDAGVKIKTPDPVSMQPGQRTSLRLTAQADDIGVHRVTLTPVTEKGQRLGTPIEFDIRTSQVGQLIWVIMVAGAVLLFAMVLRRIVIRVRRARATG